MPIQREDEERKKMQKDAITRKLSSAGIRVHPGKKVPKKGEYSGIIGESKKVLELKI